MRGYFATTVDGQELDVQIIGSWPRPVISGLCWSYIGIFRYRTPYGLSPRVIFFDQDGTMFWANGGQIDPIVAKVQPSSYRTGLAREYRGKLTYNNSSMIG